MGQVDPDFPNALPAASVDTYEEGVELRTLLCVRGYEPRQWLYKDWPKHAELDAIFMAGQEIEKAYQMMKKKKEKSREKSIHGQLRQLLAIYYGQSEDKLIAVLDEEGVLSDRVKIILSGRWMTIGDGVEEDIDEQL